MKVACSGKRQLRQGGWRNFGKRAFEEAEGFCAQVGSAILNIPLHVYRRGHGVSLKVRIEEQFVQSKSGRPEDCEDFIYVGENFIAVIDGSTAKTEIKFRGNTPGKMAGELIMTALNDTPARATAKQCVDILTQAVQEFYLAENLLGHLKTTPSLKVTATVVILSLANREVWLVGDGHALVNDKHIQRHKEIDRMLSEARATYLETELLTGKTIDELLIKDTGREAIWPFLSRQQVFQNNPHHKYWYPVIDGFPVPDDGIFTLPVVKEVKSIVLASDGYPLLCKTLALSEAALKKLLEEDPMLFRLYKSTKGKIAGQCSFDDRSFIRVSVL